MLKQGSIEEVRQQKIPRENTEIVVAMCFYPRGIKKEWRDDFRHILAPDRELFNEWKSLEKKIGHDEAFIRTNYESRFTLTPMALQLLKIYSEESKKKDIVLICQCPIGARCHREMLLLTAQKKYQAPVAEVFNSYPTYESRIQELDDHVKLW